MRPETYQSLKSSGHLGSKDMRYDGHRVEAGADRHRQAVDEDRRADQRSAKRNQQPPRATG
jgi:hypothetical protein